MPGPYPLETGMIVVAIIIFGVDWLVRRGEDNRIRTWREYIELHTREPEYYI